VKEGPVRRVKQRDNRIHHPKCWRYDNVPRIEVCSDGIITEWRHWVETDLIWYRQPPKRTQHTGTDAAWRIASKGATRLL